jgi:hypothetical protein
MNSVEDRKFGAMKDQSILLAADLQADYLNDLMNVGCNL